MRREPGCFPRYRGNPTSQTIGASTNTFAYQTTGVLQQSTINGVTVTTAPSPSTNYSLPSVLTPNGESNLATTVSYDASWAVTSVTGPNGAAANTTYDPWGRPVTSTS